MLENFQNPKNLDLVAENWQKVAFLGYLASHFLLKLWFLIKVKLVVWNFNYKRRQNVHFSHLETF